MQLISNDISKSIYRPVICSFGSKEQNKSNNTILERSPEQDKTEISGNKNCNKKRNIMIGTGIAAAVIATVGIVSAIKNKNTDYITKAQKTFQETFMRDNISREETIQMLNEYKEINKIKNTDEYITALFNNARKNYKLEHLNLKWEKSDLEKHQIAAMDASGTLNVNKNININRKELVNVIFHEFRHAKQNDIMCSANPDRYAKGILRQKSSVKILKNKYKNWISNTADKLSKTEHLSKKELDEVVMDCLIDKLTPGIKSHAVNKLGYGKSVIPDKLKDYTEKCFNAQSNYDNSNIFKYYFNFLEKDARNAGEKMKKIITTIPDKIG